MGLEVSERPVLKKTLASSRWPSLNCLNMYVLVSIAKDWTVTKDARARKGITLGLYIIVAMVFIPRKTISGTYYYEEKDDSTSTELALRRLHSTLLGQNAIRLSSRHKTVKLEGFVR